MAIIDALGQPCPVPVVRAKQAIAKLPPEGGVVEVLVDNRVACENLGKMADGSGFRHETRERDDGAFLTVIIVGAGEAASPAVVSPPPASGMVAAIGSDCMGRGSEELGRALAKGFIYSLAQLDPPPRAVVFFNSGVRLVLREANTVEDIRALAEKGCRVLVCGACVDYYQCGDKIAVGEITNMYGIAGEMAAAANVVSI